MIDKNKIPEPTLNELIELFGEIESEKILEDLEYNFRGIQNKILSERLIRRFGKRFWWYFFGILLILAIIYEILKSKMII